MRKNIYWNSKGKYSKEYESLMYLVPSQGAADTVEGELLRACSKIYYDYYNNAFINNWSGFFNYLFSKNEELALDLDEELKSLKDYKMGSLGPVQGTNTQLETSLESMVSKVLKHILDQKGVYHPNTKDALSLQEQESFKPFFEEIDPWDDF